MMVNWYNSLMVIVAIGLGSASLPAESAGVLLRSGLEVMPVALDHGAGCLTPLLGRAVRLATIRWTGERHGH